MARQGGQKSAESSASTSGFDWGKVTTIAVAVTAVSGALVAVSGNLPKLIGAFSGGAANESAASASPAAAVTGPAPAKAEASAGTTSSVQGPRFVRHRDGSEETVCAPGQDLVGGNCISPRRVVVASSRCPTGETRDGAGRCEPPAMPVPDCPPGWTRDADICQAPSAPPPETKQCPDGSTISVTEECLPALPVGARRCPDGSFVPFHQQCPRQITFSDPFILFFDWDEDQITPAAAAILDNAAAGYGQLGPAPVVIAAHTDRSGPAHYNVLLSQRRADNVRDYLAGRGVPLDAITVESYGESRPLVDTADGVREPQNRRVEVTFGSDPGR